MPEQRNTAVSSPKQGMGLRHVQALLLFLGLALAYGVRATMSIAIVAMTNRELTSRPFHWSTQIQTVVLSSFMVGYVISQVPGRRLAAKFGGKVFMVVGVAASCAVSAFIPLGAYDGNWELTIVLRILQGLAQGAMVPAILNLIDNWIPLEEKKFTETLILFGSIVGVFFQFLISGFVIRTWGWCRLFYINTFIGLVWSITYIVFGSNSAETSKFITNNERLYIRNSLKQDNDPEELKTPWYALWTSLPFLTLVIATCAHKWGMWTLITLLPMYFSRTQDISIEMVGLVSAMPYMGMFLMVLPFRFASILLIKRKYVSTTATRKLFSGIGLFGPATGLVLLAVLNFDVIMTTLILTLSMMLHAAQYSGFMQGPEDMAPNFSERMRRITSGFGDLLSVFAPFTAGMILTNETTDGWRFVFYLCAAIYVICGIVYITLGTSERQPWNQCYSDSTHVRSPYLKQESRRDQASIS